MQSKCVWLFSTNLAHIITNLKQSLDNITGVRVMEGDTTACMVSISESESGVAQSSLTLCDPVDCIAYQAPPSMGFSRQGYWSGLPFPSPGIFLTQGSNPGLLHCRQTLYHLSHLGSNFSKNQNLLGE